MISKALPVVGLIALVGLCVFFPVLIVVAFPFMLACLQVLGVVPK